MGEWERRWRGPPREPDEELPKATVRFLDSLRVMVADTYPGGPGDVVAIRPGDDSEEDDDCDDWEGKMLTARDVCDHVRETLGWSSKNLRVTWNGRALRDKEKLYEAGVRFDSTIHVVDAARLPREEGELPGKSAAPVAGAEPGEVSPVKRQFPVEAAEEVLEAPNPYAPAPAEPDDDWRARTRLVCTPQGPVRY